MNKLRKDWRAQQWSEFAQRFKAKYKVSDNAQQLTMLRSLLSEFRDGKALRAVLDEMPELKSISIGTIVAK